MGTPIRRWSGISWASETYATQDEAIVASEVVAALVAHLFQFLDLHSGQAFGFGTRGIHA